MGENLALRLAVSTGTVSPEDYETTLDYATDVPVWPSGLEAARHGLAAIKNPGQAARALVDRLDRKARRRGP